MSTDLRAEVARRLAHIAEPWAPLPPGPPVPPSERAGGRRLSLDRRALRALAALVAVAVLAAGWVWWQGRPRPVALAPVAGAPSALGVPSAPAFATGEVVVHVIGAVRRPGLVHLRAGSRVAEAIDAVGGASSPKALATVNLARLLVDGEQIVVGAAAAAQESGVNLNTADATAFEALPGVGPVLATRIVDWRAKNGPFRSVDELGEVAGIGDAILAQLRAQVHV